MAAFGSICALSLQGSPCKHLPCLWAYIPVGANMPRDAKLGALPQKAEQQRKTMTLVIVTSRWDTGFF
eukprot:1332000-Amphidinium_carterae.5